MIAIVNILTKLLKIKLRLKTSISGKIELPEKFLTINFVIKLTCI